MVKYIRHTELCQQQNEIIGEKNEKDIGFYTFKRFHAVSFRLRSHG